MTSDQKMVAMIGIGLVILAALTIYRPYLHAVFFTPGAKTPNPNNLKPIKGSGGFYQNPVKVGRGAAPIRG